MGMPEMLTPTYWTAEMVRALPDDGQRHEVVYGELLVTPAPRLWHQELVLRLARRLGDYLDRVPIGHLVLSPADISWDEGTLLQPDLFVADLAEARTMEWVAIRNLLLVVEILSPSTARVDRFTKRRRYQEAGVSDYWIVDPDRNIVEVWHPTDQLPRIEAVEVTWTPAGATDSLVLTLADLFRPLQSPS